MTSLQDTINTELAAKNDAICFLEKQLVTVKNELELRERTLKDRHDSKMGELELKLKDTLCKFEECNASNVLLSERNKELKATHEKDMVKVETRVKDALAKRDLIISQLQEELLSMTQNLEQVEALE